MHVLTTTPKTPTPPQPLPWWAGPVFTLIGLAVVACELLYVVAWIATGIGLIAFVARLLHCL